MAGLAAGLIFLAATAGILLWSKPWKKAPAEAPTRPGTPGNPPQPK